MNQTEVLALINEAFADAAPEKAAQAGTIADPSQSLADLEIDSILALEIAGYVEEKLDMTFPDDELARVSTIDGFIGLVLRYRPATVRVTG